MATQFLILEYSIRRHTVDLVLNHTGTPFWPVLVRTNRSHLQQWRIVPHLPPQRHKHFPWIATIAGYPAPHNWRRLQSRCHRRNKSWIQQWYRQTDRLNNSYVVALSVHATALSCEYSDSKNKTGISSGSTLCTPIIFSTSAPVSTAVPLVTTNERQQFPKLPQFHLIYVTTGFRKSRQHHAFKFNPFVWLGIGVVW